MAVHSIQLAALLSLIIGCVGLGLASLGDNSTDGQHSRNFLIKAGRLLDVVSGNILRDQAILVEGDRIKEVGHAPTIVSGAPEIEIIDLGDSMVLPGLIDCHTHILLQGTLGPVYDEQLLKDSTAFRAIRASVSVRTALMNGFTSMRDLSSGGAMYADVDVKRAINLGHIDGPRMFVATRGLAPTAVFPLVGYSWELRLPDGVQIVDGVDDIRKAVREQIKNGADWIKYFSDTWFYIKDGTVHSRPMFTDEEACVIVNEAHRLGHKVATHAYGHEAIEAGLKAGVDSIEHGFGLDERLMDLMISRGTYWCPTLFIADYFGERIPPSHAAVWKAAAELESKAFAMAATKGVRVVFGTDLGGIPWNENGAKEFEYQMKYGMRPIQAIQSATIRAAELLEAAGDIGSLQPGRCADIVAVKGNPLDDITVLKHVSFVMAGGRVVRNDDRGHS